MTKLPDIYQIVKYSECGMLLFLLLSPSPPNSLFLLIIEETFKELEKMLSLLIGCAINGDSKELFIENIQMNIDTQIQIELVPYIELVTEDMSFSISKNLNLAIEQQQQQQQQQTTPDTSISSSTSSFIQTCQQLIQNHQNNNLNQSNDILINKLLINIQRVIDERDLFSESIIELQQDKDFLIQQLNQNGFKFKLNNNNNGKKYSSFVHVNNEMMNCNENENDHNQNENNVNNNNNNNNHLLNDGESGGGGGGKQQKLSLELVEYKVKMRQLRMEM